MKKIYLLLGIGLIKVSVLLADEGMWLLTQIYQNYDRMKEMGLKLSPEDIYSINQSCLKDAIVGFGFAGGTGDGFFCTGEIISPDGLLLTNHHCGYDQIQKHSSLQHDYLSDGFWAMTRAEELPATGITVSVLVRMEDVTQKVTEGLTDQQGFEERNEAISKKSEELIAEAQKDNHYQIVVKSMYFGNQFIMFVYETFQDVRLVGAPPESIGKFGGDTDNWVWPRHTGDFCLLRIYSGADGNPAEYAQENIPYKPKHHLPVSIKGVKKDDYAMVFGFPGNTQRYLTSEGIAQTMNNVNEVRVKVRTKKLDIIKADMDASREAAKKITDLSKKPKIHIQYASKYSQSSNYWKYSIGQNQGLKRLNVFDERKKLEEQFRTWANSDPSRKEKYGKVLDRIENGYKMKEKDDYALQYIAEALLEGGELILFPFQSFELYNTLRTQPDNKEMISETVKQVKENARAFYKDYNVETDKKVFTALFKMYFDNVTSDYYLYNTTSEVKKKFLFFGKKIITDTTYIHEIIKTNYQGNFKAYTDDLYAKSIFTDSVKFFTFLQNPTADGIGNDMAFVIMRTIMIKYFEIMRKVNDIQNSLEEDEYLFMKGLLEMQNGKMFYPDANSTPRITFGKVNDYYPYDAVHYDFYTSLSGVMEKEDPDNTEFIVFPKLKELYEKKDFGRYAENGELHTCFITNNDITGGNSGSPVINGNGELIGTAFDGNWEAMTGDIQFENQLQRCINLDIRYVLFIIDKFAGANHLINEMTIVE